MKPVRVLILGTGGMANVHAEAYAKMPGVTLAAGVDLNPGRRAEFMARHRMERGFASVEEALEWGEFDAVSNVTPDPVHYPTTMPLLAAGKHVLCEKPLAVNGADARAMADAAKAAGVVNMVNLSYRNVPALVQASAMIDAGELGEIRHFESSYLQSWLTQPAWGEWSTESMWLWRLSTAHGSTGVLGDIGVHILDFATYAAGLTVADISCRLTTFHKAEGDKIGEYVLDANDSFAMHLSLANGATGVIHASRMASGHLNDLYLRIYGTKGGLEIRFEDEVSVLRACLSPDLQKAEWHDIPTPPIPTNYERFIAAVRTETQVLPDFARGAELQHLLDQAAASDAQGSLRLTV